MMQECTSNAVGILDCGSNAARMRLECSSNDPTRMQECISIASRLQHETKKIIQLEYTLNTVRIFRLPLEYSWNVRQEKKNDPNAPQMHLDCRRNLFQYFQYFKDPTGMHFECRRNLRLPLECSLNVPTRMQECISIAAGIYFDIFNTLRI